MSICENGETLGIEFKEFFIKNLVKKSYERSDLIDLYHDYILSGRMYSNEEVLISLERDFKKYIPKYLSGWNNKCLSLDYGRIYFGIKDDGTMVGIPFKGVLTKELIKELIIKSFINIRMKDVDKGKISELKEKINVGILKINPRTKETLVEYKKIIEQEDSYLKEREELLLKYKEWHKKILKWHIKLIEILNNEERRKDFLKWTNENCFESNKEEILKKIENWKRMEEFDVRISEIKYDESNIYYWLCLYKDIITAEIVNSKPQIIKRKGYDWSNFYLSPYMMNNLIKELNPDVNFYILQIDLPNIKIPIYVKNKEKWMRYLRITNKLGPSSSPIFIE